jgi:hypothetical protein
MSQKVSISSSLQRESLSDALWGCGKAPLEFCSFAKGNKMVRFSATNFEVWRGQMSRTITHQEQFGHKNQFQKRLIPQFLLILHHPLNCGEFKACDQQFVAGRIFWGNDKQRSESHTVTFRSWTKIVYYKICDISASPFQLMTRGFFWSSHCLPCQSSDKVFNPKSQYFLNINQFMTRL